MWNSENENLYDGVNYFARGLVRAYVETNSTGFIAWPLTQGSFDHLPFMDNVLPSIANQPWSGHYSFSTAIWAFAHVNQFVEPGWVYDDAATGYLTGGGSFVTLRSNDSSNHVTVIIETVSCEHPTSQPHPPILCTNSTSPPQTIRLVLPASISKMALWTSSVLSNNDTSGWFLRQSDLVVTDGSLSFDLPPNMMATLTSQLDKGYKGNFTDAKVPASAPFPKLYQVAFNSTPIDTTVASFLIDQRGVFEMVEDSSFGRVLQVSVSQVCCVPFFSFYFFGFALILLSYSMYVLRLSETTY